MITRLLETFLRTRYGFVAALAAALLLMSMNEAGYQHASGRASSGIALTEARIQAAQSLQWLTDAETAVRGHILAGDGDRLQPYRQSVAQLQAVQSRTFELLRSVSANRDVELDQLQRLLQERLAVLANMAALAERDGPAALAAAAVDARQQSTAALRGKFNAVLEHAVAMQQGARTSVYDAMGLSRWTVHLLTLVIVLGLFIHTRKLHALDQLRREAQARLTDQVSERTVQLRELASHLVTAREDERGRLARDLHDELGGQFTAMKLQFARLRGQTDISDAMRSSLRALEDRLNDAIAFKRLVIENLRPSALEQLGLATSLGMLCRDAAQSMGIAVHEELSPPAKGALAGLSSDAELTVYRLVQESLTNIAKYAQARQVRVCVHPHGDELHVRVEDNGCGFDAQHVPTGHHGLLGMRYRVESEGGSMRVLSTPGQGTCIEATLPLMVERKSRVRDDLRSQQTMQPERVQGLAVATAQ